ncbi:MAG: class I SAM-dependent methyltransferase [Anaerolineaceae bacterium]|nr:class I SAM-dependent methyltransferase [Anaerolineaceae bacterium]
MTDQQQETAQARWRELAQPQTGWVVLDVAAQTYTVTDAGVSQSAPLTDPVNLPLPDGHFDLVTCRNAARCFPDSYRFMLEVARLLKSGGVFLMEDALMPDDERAAGYVNAFMKLRDSGHIRAYAGYEWEGTALDAGLQIAQAEPFAYTVPLLDPEQVYTAYARERLHILLKQAPQAVREWLHPHCVGTDDAAFTAHTFILKTVKLA